MPDAVDTLTRLFSHVCGQGRCFVVDGVPLPVCQRCLGLYAGAALTGIWVLASGLWRRGLPNRSIVVSHAVLLVLAMLSGLHVFDPGPTWRLLCGLWTGYVAALWLVGGASQLWAASRPQAYARMTWRRRDTFAAWAALPLLAILAWSFPALACVGWGTWAGACALGALFILIAASWAIVAAGAWGRVNGP